MHVTRDPTGASSEMRIAIAGFGAIGRAVASRIAAGSVPRAAVTAVSARDCSRAAAAAALIDGRIVVCAVEALSDHADIVVECAPAELFADIATPFLIAGKCVIVLSVGALLQRPELVDLARAHGGRLLVPTGALLGLDAVAAAAVGEVSLVRLVSRKPVAALQGAPWLVKNGIDISAISEATRVFAGSAREAAAGFPANINVAAALALAGVGPDRTQVEIWADPALTRNVHQIVVESDAAHLDMRIENIPSANPRTGRITAQSVIALLRKHGSALCVGT